MSKVSMHLFYPNGIIEAELNHLILCYVSHKKSSPDGTFLSKALSNDDITEGLTSLHEKLTSYRCTAMMSIVKLSDERGINATSNIGYRRFNVLLKL